MEGVDLSGIEVWYLRELAYKVLGSPIVIVVSVICRDQCIYYLYT